MARRGVSGRSVDPVAAEEIGGASGKNHKPEDAEQGAIGLGHRACPGHPREKGTGGELHHPDPANSEKVQEGYAAPHEMRRKEAAPYTRRSTAGCLKVVYCRP